MTDIKNIVVLLIGLVLFYFLGMWLKKYLSQKGTNFHENFGTVEGALLALFAFFLGFTFSISASKIETVRITSIQEANAISTALLRTQLYDDAQQVEYKRKFKDYVKSRIDYFDNPDKKEETLSATEKNGIEIWNYALDLRKKGEDENNFRLFGPSVNDMLDAVAIRDSAIESKLPNSIVWTLFALSFCSCFIVGFSMKSSVLNNMIGFTYIIIVALTVNLILDAGNPMEGFINTSKANEGIKAIYEKL